MSAFIDPHPTRMKQPSPQPTATPLEALGIVTLCFGWFIIGSLWSVSAGFRDAAFDDASLFGIVAGFVDSHARKQLARAVWWHNRELAGTR